MSFEWFTGFVTGGFVVVIMFFLRFKLGEFCEEHARRPRGVPNCPHPPPMPPHIGIPNLRKYVPIPPPYTSRSKPGYNPPPEGVTKPPPPPPPPPR